MIHRGLFVVGTDTGIGKTFVSATLMAASQQTVYWKPLQTGPLEDHDTPWVQAHAQLPALVPGDRLQVERRQAAPRLGQLAAGGQLAVEGDSRQRVVSEHARRHKQRAG